MKIELFSDRNFSETIIKFFTFFKKEAMMTAFIFFSLLLLTDVYIAGNLFSLDNLNIIRGVIYLGWIISTPMFFMKLITEAADKHEKKNIKIAELNKIYNIISQLPQSEKNFLKKFIEQNTNTLHINAQELNLARDINLKTELIRIVMTANMDFIAFIDPETFEIIKRALRK